VGERLEKDKKQADELGLDGTPFLFINGRYVNLTLLATQDDVSDWIKLDIELAGQKPMPAAAAAPVAPAHTTIPAVASGASVAPAPNKK
jgi:hypothetical protein